MARPKTTAAAAYPLILAAIFAAALPPLVAQLAPAAAPMYPAAAAPSPGVDCFAYLINLSDCLTFVEGGSNLTKPDPGCCPELAKLVDTQPICLCKMLGDPSLTGITVDVKRALKLPGVCNVTTPPVSLCAAIGIPVGALTPSEAPSGGGPPAASPSPMNGGNGNGNGNGSGSSSNLVSNNNFLIGLAAVLFTYFV